VYPVLLLPLLLVREARQSGLGAAARSACVAGLAFAVVVLPFAMLAPGGVAYSFKSQLTRVLEIESLGGALLLSAHRLAAYDPTIHAGLSYELTGGLPVALGMVQLLILAVGLAIVWFAFWRSAQSGSDVVLAAAATLTVAVAFDKVLSPQYLVWLVPVVALLWGRIGALAWSLSATAMILTATYFPSRFHDLRHEGPTAWIVLARDVVLVVLAAALAAAVARGGRRPVQGL